MAANNTPAAINSSLSVLNGHEEISNFLVVGPTRWRNTLWSSYRRWHNYTWCSIFFPRFFFLLFRFGARWPRAGRRARLTGEWLNYWSAWWKIGFDALQRLSRWLGPIIGSPGLIVSDLRGCIKNYYFLFYFNYMQSGIDKRDGLGGMHFSLVIIIGSCGFFFF